MHAPHHAMATGNRPERKKLVKHFIGRCHVTLSFLKWNQCGDMRTEQCESRMAACGKQFY